MICVVTHNQLREWQKTGERPSCKHHRHLSYYKVLTHIMNDEATFDSEKRAVVIYPCIERYAWRGKRSDHHSCMQMVPIGT